MNAYYDESERMVHRTGPGVLGTTDEVKYWYNAGGNRIGKQYTYHVQVACNDTAPPIELFGMQSLAGDGTELNSVQPPGNCTRSDSTLTGYYYFGNDLVAEYAGSGYTGGVLSANYINRFLRSSAHIECLVWCSHSRHQLSWLKAQRWKAKRVRQLVALHREQVVLGKRVELLEDVSAHRSRKMYSSQMKSRIKASLDQRRVATN